MSGRTDLQKENALMVACVGTRAMFSRQTGESEGGGETGKKGTKGEREGPSSKTTTGRRSECSCDTDGDPLFSWLLPVVCFLQRKEMPFFYI